MTETNGDTPPGPADTEAEAVPDDERPDDDGLLGEIEGAGPARRETASRQGPEPRAAPTGGLGPGAEEERLGHPVRRYLMGVSGAALALAWARQENAPDGAVVVVDREVSPLGRLGRMWSVRPESTLSCALVLRPPLSVEEADATWLLVGAAVSEGAAAASGRALATWWPDLVVDAETSEEVAALKVEIQLGPGKVKSAVASVRVDLDKLGVGAGGREDVLDAILTALDRHREDLGQGSSGVAAAYQGQCGLVGRRVKIRLFPKGETRGRARGVDRSGRLELESATGMLQKVSVDMLRELQAV